MDKFDKLISTKTGLKPFIITEFRSETHVSVGTIISFLLGFLFKIFKILIVIKFADDPEFTKVEYFTPSHFDQDFSNFSTCDDWVKIIFFFLTTLLLLQNPDL